MRRSRLQVAAAATVIRKGPRSGPNAAHISRSSLYEATRAIERGYRGRSFDRWPRKRERVTPARSISTIKLRHHCTYARRATVEKIGQSSACFIDVTPPVAKWGLGNRDDDCLGEMTNRTLICGSLKISVCSTGSVKTIDIAPPHSGHGGSFFGSARRGDIG